MTLGQPTTPAELAAEQRRLEARAAARERRDRAIIDQVAELTATGVPLDDAIGQVARRAKLGRGATAYVRKLVQA